MAEHALVLGEVIALLQVVGLKDNDIEAFRKHAQTVINKRNARSVEVERPPDAEPGLDSISISSGFGTKSQRGFVQFRLNDTISQLDAPKAREVGLMLLEAAEAAISDEIFAKLLTKIGSLPAAAVGEMLLQLREIRQGTRGIAWPS